MYRKHRKGRIRGFATSGNEVSYGEYGVKLLEANCKGSRSRGARISSRQIESARKAAVRCMERKGRIWIRIHPDVPVTKKPLEVRMGKGKGAVDRHVAKVKPGNILFEFTGVSEKIARSAAYLLSAKLPVKTKFVKRIIFDESSLEKLNKF